MTQYDGTAAHLDSPPLPPAHADPYFGVSHLDPILRPGDDEPSAPPRLGCVAVALWIIGAIIVSQVILVARDFL